MTNTKEWTFLFILAPIQQFSQNGLSKSCPGIPSERVSDVTSPRNGPRPAKNPKLSCKASLNLRNGFSSKMNQNKRVVMIKYKYKYTNTNTNTQIQIQIRTYKYKYKYRKGSGVKF